MLITWIAIEKHIQETDTKQQSKKQKSTENTGNGKPLVSLRDVRIAMFYVRRPSLPPLLSLLRYYFAGWLSSAPAT